MKRLLAVGIAAFCIAAAYAQGVPTLWLATPNGQEAVNVTAYSPGAQIASVAVGAIRDARGYSKQVPLTGATITFGGAIGCSPVSATAGACTSVLQLTPAGTLATLTIKTPLYPVDGEVMQIFSTQIITALTMTASQSQTIDGGLTALAANTGYAWLYSAGSSATNGTWDRIQ
jgi:hypothetical protein